LQKHLASSERYLSPSINTHDFFFARGIREREMMILNVFLVLVQANFNIPVKTQCLNCILMSEFTSDMSQCCALYEELTRPSFIADEEQLDFEAQILSQCSFMCSQIELLRRHNVGSESCELLQICQFNGERSVYCLYLILFKYTEQQQLEQTDYVKKERRRLKLRLEAAQAVDVLAEDRATTNAVTPSSAPLPSVPLSTATTTASTAAAAAPVLSDEVLKEALRIVREHRLQLA
jgi:hypothetical protein